ARPAALPTPRSGGVRPGNNPADEQDVLPDAGGERVFGRRTWRALHEVRLFHFGRQRERRQSIGHQVNPQDLNGHERDWHPQERRDENHQQLGAVAGHHVFDDLAQIVIDAPPLTYRGAKLSSSSSAATVYGWQLVSPERRRSRLRLRMQVWPSEAWCWQPAEQCGGPLGSFEVSQGGSTVTAYCHVMVGTRR